MCIIKHGTFGIHSFDHSLHKHEVLTDVNITEFIRKFLVLL